MGKMSREKGKRGELEVAHILQAYGYDGRRGAQHHGGKDSPDVKGLPGIHIEVKRTERFDLYGALSQAIGDCGGNLPVVIHRKNECKWVAVQPLDDWMKLYAAWEQQQKELELMEKVK